MAEFWTSRNGTPVNLTDVDEAKLAALYAAEGDTGTLDQFTQAYENANLRTRNAWSYGYMNPRTTHQEESKK